MKIETKNEIIRIVVIMFILLFSAFVLSCSAESVDEDCECVKETYEIEQFVCYGQSGLPQLCFDRVVIDSESVNCHDEYDNVENANGTFTRVVCNN